MSSKTANKNSTDFYSKHNRIRSKLLLFIDNEIQSKIKESNQNLKLNCEDEILIKISFEETFTQKQINNHYHSSSSSILKIRKNNNSDKSFSTIDNSPNKITKTSTKKIRNSHSKTLIKKDTSTNKLFDNIICFNEKVYSLKNVSRQSSTFLILPKQKKSAEYLKSLCNNLKICKNDKKPVKKFKTLSIKSKLLNLNQEKKSPNKPNKTKTLKFKKVNKNVYSLFRKSQKDNFEINSKLRTSRKLASSVLIKFKQKE